MLNEAMNNATFVPTKLYSDKRDICTIPFEDINSLKNTSLK